MDEDRYITIVDRKKGMIMTAGFNVYPAELDASCACIRRSCSAR